MSTLDSYPPGTPCWVDVTSRDPAASLAFYRTLFGWQSAEPDEGFATFTVGGQPVAGLGPCPADLRPSWNAYLSVADVDAAAVAAQKAGGQLVAGPADIPGAGRAAACADPQGAVFTLWQAREHVGAGLTKVPGAWFWTELVTTDLPAAAAFYATVFGWRVRGDASTEAGGAVAILDGLGVAGFSPVPTGAGISPYWSVTFQVTDCDATAAAVVELGGTMAISPRAITSVGRYAIAAGLDGETFSILAPNA